MGWDVQQLTRKSPPIVLYEIFGFRRGEFPLFPPKGLLFVVVSSVLTKKWLFVLHLPLHRVVVAAAAMVIKRGHRDVEDCEPVSHLSFFLSPA